MEEDRGIAAAVGVLGASCLGMALIPLRGLTPAANLTFAFVILTIAIAEWGGRLAAVATAFASALSLDFFLTRPYLQLAMAEKDDVIAFVGLTLCGLVAAAFATGGARRAAAVRHGKVVQRALRLVEEGGPPEIALTRVLEEARVSLPVAALSVRDLGGALVAGTGAVAARGLALKRLQPDTLVGEGESERAHGRPRPLPSDGGRLELVAGNRIVGVLELWGDGEAAVAEERQALTSLARAIAARLALGS
jgi:hypothetical protein